MKWIEITVNTTDAGADFVSARLSMLGIDEINIIQGREAVERIMVNTVKYWDYADDAALDKEPAVQACVADLPENDGIVERIKEAMKDLKGMEEELSVPLGSLDVFVRQVDEEDWANNWKAYYKPICIGEKLIICPTWETVDVPDGRTVLRIDPGMAFGTGNHHTTRMCLELLEKYLKPGMNVIDVGCGSGILSTAAVIMGADNAVAIDIDPVATKIAPETALLNGIDFTKYTVYTGDILSDEKIRAAVLTRKYDVVLANIVAGVIIDLAPFVPMLMHKDSIFIASGIIDERLDEVIEALNKNGIEVNEIRCGEDWRALEARLK